MKTLFFTFNFKKFYEHLYKIKKFENHVFVFSIFCRNFLFYFYSKFYFLIYFGFFLDDLLRGLPRDTKMTTGNGLKVACSNTVLLFFTKVFL